MINKKYEQKLYNEILVDCIDESEQYMSWFYYAQDEMEFPFEAKIELKKREGGITIEKVKIINLTNEEGSLGRNLGLKVDIELGDYIIAVPLETLTNIKSDEPTAEIINIWKYWIRE